MGAHTFSVHIDGDITAEEAYNIAVEDAIYEYGHDSYNGTISTTSGFKILSSKSLSREEVKKRARQAFDNDEVEKWEAAGAIRTTDGWLFIGWAAS